MAQMPNPSVNPMVGDGGFMRPEWVRYFSELQTAATPAPTASPTPAPTAAPTPAPTLPPSNDSQVLLASRVFATRPAPPPPVDDSQAMLAMRVIATRPAPPPPVDESQAVLAMQVFRRR